MDKIRDHLDKICIKKSDSKFKILVINNNNNYNKTEKKKITSWMLEYKINLIQLKILHNSSTIQLKWQYKIVILKILEYSCLDVTVFFLNKKIKFV